MERDAGMRQPLSLTTLSGNVHDEINPMKFVGIRYPSQIGFVKGMAMVTIQVSTLHPDQAL